MRLASSETAIRLENETIHLRASLRAAFRLEQQYGFQDLCEAIAHCELTACVDLIQECSADPEAVDRFFKFLYGRSIEGAILEFREQLLRFVLVLAGAEERSRGEEPTGTPIPFDEYHTRLFRLATGWLGWPPEVAWSATSAEILEAQKGRIEMLRAVFGGKQEDESETTADVRSVKDRLNALGDSTITNMADVPCP